MEVIANRQLRGEYGTVAPDQSFECRNETAQQLLKAGLVRNAMPPVIEYQTKVIVPEAPEVSPRHPFRDVSVPHKESAGVATESNRVLPAADVPKSGAPDSRGRARRS